MSEKSRDASGKMTRREMLRLMGLAAAGTALAACPPSPAAPAPEAEVVDEVPVARDAIEVRFWNVWGAAREDLMNDIAARFEEENPSIRIRNLVQPFEGRAENLFTAIASREPPEVLMATRMEMLRFADDGLITPIEDFVDSHGVDLDRFYPAEIGNMWWEGHLYSMPMPTGGGITGLVLTNEDMFEAAGQEPVVPQTWSELEEVARDFTEVDDRGLLQVGAHVGDGVGPFFGWLYCNNGQIYNEDLTAPAFNSPEGVETLEWMVNFTNEINGGVQNVTDFFAAPGEATAAQPWYNDVQLINFPNVSIFFHMETYKPDMQWDMGLRPYNANNPQATSQGVAGEEFAWSYVIPRALSAEVQEAAFLWVKEITYSEGGCWFMQEQARPSPIIECNESPVYHERNPHWDKVMESLASDVSADILPIHARVRDYVDQAVQAAMFGAASPQQALEEAAQLTQAVIDEYWSERA